MEQHEPSAYEPGWPIYLADHALTCIVEALRALLLIGMQGFCLYFPLQCLDDNQTCPGVDLGSQLQVGKRWMSPPTGSVER
jgi:hypothetical protein